MKNTAKQTMRAFIGERPFILLSTTDTADKAIALLPELDTGAAGVVDEQGALTGILTVRDLLKRVLGAGINPSAVRIGDIMTRDPVTVDSGTCIQEALDIMTRSGYRYLPIMDGGAMAGMADIRDLYKTIQALLHQKMEYKASLLARIFSEPYGYDPHPYASPEADSASA